MEIIAHRGCWDLENEQNSALSIRRALANGVGCELDIHLLDGKLVISHDPPTSKNQYVLLSDVFNDFHKTQNQVLALNIKQDGISSSLGNLVSENRHVKYFCFDMSLPELLKYRDLSLSYAVRVSEYEPLNELLLTYASAIWLDAFEYDWWSQDTLNDLCNAKVGIKVVIVSPELHSRDPRHIWALAQTSSFAKGQLAICTDLVDEARRYFR